MKQKHVFIWVNGCKTNDRAKVTIYIMDSPSSTQIPSSFCFIFQLPPQLSFVFLLSFQGVFFHLYKGSDRAMSSPSKEELLLESSQLEVLSVL
jgi:hypothetical protein